VQSSAGISRQKRGGRPVFLGALLLLGILAAICHPGQRVLADSDTALQDTARKLAERIAAIPGVRGPLRLEWHPEETWSEGEGTRWQDALREAFNRRALPLSDEAAVPALAVYAAETPTEIVLTVKTHVGDREEVRIVAVSRVSLPPAELPVAPVRLEHQLIYESPDRILDASSFSSNADGGLALLLYRNFEVTALRLDAGGTLKQTVVLNANLKPTRDPRGEISFHGKAASVQLWGKSCDFSWDSTSEAKCRPEKANASASLGWPTDAVLVSPCDETNWTIAEPTGELTARAVLRLVPEGATEGSSSTLTSEFPGPVLNASSGQNRASALVIARNLRTGNYEVYQISLVCGD
jgi:hypothetical protein